MGAWTVLTLIFNNPSPTHNEEQIPDELREDDSINEQGFTDEERYYALSYGWTTDTDFISILEDLDEEAKNAIQTAYITTANNTSDYALVSAFEFEDEELVKVDQFDGTPYSKRLKDEIREQTGSEPVITSADTSPSPDFVIREE